MKKIIYTENKVILSWLIMKMESFQYLNNAGWSIKNFPDLDSEETLIIIFASPTFKNCPEPLAELSDFYKKAKIMGCSTAGEIFGSRIFDDSLSVSVIRFEKTALKLITKKIDAAEDSFKVGNYIASALGQTELHGILVLSDGLKVNGTELIRGFNQKLGQDVIITGGLAGDGANFKKTWVISAGKILENHVVAVGFYGKHISIGHAFKGGWDIFGPERRITHSKGNVLYELDNRPVLSLYKEYLGERAKELPASGLLYPLAIRNPAEKESTPLVRTILNIDEKEQTLIFAGDMPEGCYAQLMRANFDRLIESASEASELVHHDCCKNKPIFAIDISCVGRRLLLGERTDEETEATFKTLPSGSIQIGFYSYGELSPGNTGNCELHNQTMTISTFCEKDA